MTPEQQQLLDALHRQTLAIYITGALIFLAVVAVLVVWWVEYRADRREKQGGTGDGVGFYGATPVNIRSAEGRRYRSSQRRGAYVVGAAEGRRRTQTRHGRGGYPSGWTLVEDLRAPEGHEGNPE